MPTNSLQTGKDRWRKSHAGPTTTPDPTDLTNGAVRADFLVKADEGNAGAAATVAAWYDRIARQGESGNSEA
jgi:hypothetical protein